MHIVSAIHVVSIILVLCRLPRLLERFVIGLCVFHSSSNTCHLLSVVLRDSEILK